MRLVLRPNRLFLGSEHGGQPRAVESRPEERHRPERREVDGSGGLRRRLRPRGNEGNGRAVEEVEERAAGEERDAGTAENERGGALVVALVDLLVVLVALLRREVLAGALLFQVPDAGLRAQRRRVGDSSA